MPNRACGAVVAALAISMSISSAAEPGQSAPDRTARLRIEIVGFRSERGEARIALWRSKDGFPGDVQKAVRRFAVPIVQGRAKLLVEGLEPGAYAVAAFHDENRNGVLDTGFMGIPKEGVAISRGARSRFGRPSFDDAKLEIIPGEQPLVLTMAY